MSGWDGRMVKTVGFGITVRTREEKRMGVELEER